MKRVFAKSHQDDDPGHYCVETCVACVLEIPLEDVPTRRGAGGGHLKPWLHQRGFILWGVDPAYAPISGYMMLGGKVHNDSVQKHMIVGYGGHPIFDPNPSQKGLAIIDSAHLFVPFDLAEWPEVVARSGGGVFGI